LNLREEDLGAEHLGAVVIQGGEVAAGGGQRMWRWDSRSIWRWEFARGRGTHIWRIGLGGFAFFLKKNYTIFCIPHHANAGHQK
jgi:hypothetical protein